jgi:hypothetical protein
VSNYLLIASGADRRPQIVSLLLAQPIAISRERLVCLFSYHIWLKVKKVFPFSSSIATYAGYAGTVENISQAYGQ